MAGQAIHERAPDDEARRVAGILERHLAEASDRQSALLPILHDIQAAFGHIPGAAVPQLALALNISRAEVHGVVSFYHDFRAQPAGRHVVKLCQAEACQAMGARMLAREATAALGIGLGQTTPDRRITVEPIYCLGLCATAPAALVDDRPVGRLDTARLRGIMAGLA